MTKTVKIDGRTKDEVIRDQRKEIAELRQEIINMRADHREQWDRLCPNLPDEMRSRARAVWEAALHSHETATAGQPGPAGVIAMALTDAEKVGPRRLKGGEIDPVAFVAGRIESIAQANGRDPMDLFEQVCRRMNPDPVGPELGENDEEEGEDDVGEESP